MKELGSGKLTAGPTMQEVKIALVQNPNWQGEINSLTLTFKGASGSTIEIDSIKVER